VDVCSPGPTNLYGLFIHCKRNESWDNYFSTENSLYHFVEDWKRTILLTDVVPDATGLFARRHRKTCFANAWLDGSIYTPYMNRKQKVGVSKWLFELTSRMFKVHDTETMACQV
jgi:hypothetical protein